MRAVAGEKKRAHTTYRNIKSFLSGAFKWARQEGLIDKNNNPVLARRPIIGINIFHGMKPMADNKWSGRIYNADNGKTYASDVTFSAPRKLEVRGCVMAVLCGGETWTKLVGVAQAD